MKRCLVIDDSRVMRKVACAILEQMQFETAEAEDGPDAIAQCRTQMPELILLDLNLPNRAGLEFLRDLRREPGGNRPVVVFSTTENDIRQISEALAVGANEYVMKPFDRGILESKLATVGLA